MGPPNNFPSSDAWIGLRSRGGRQRFFNDGNACPYRKWYAGIDPEHRPKSAHFNKNCTVIDSEGDWDVANCNQKTSVRAYICKKRAGYQ